MPMQIYLIIYSFHNYKFESTHRAHMHAYIYIYGSVGRAAVSFLLLGLWCRMCGYLGSNPVHAKLDFRNQFLIVGCASAFRGQLYTYIRFKL